MIDTTSTLGYWKKGGPNGQLYGEFDRDADLAFSFDGSNWAAATFPGRTLQSFTVLPDARLTVVAQALLNGEMTVRLRKTDPTVTADIGAFLPFTLRMFLDDGQHDDRTFNLRVLDR